MGEVVLAVLLVALAAARLTRLSVLDDLLEPWWRTRVLERFPQTPPGKDPTLRNKLGDLISCGYCSGWWWSVGALAVAHLVGLAWWPLKWDLLLVWSVAAVQMLVNAIDAHL
jgi:hypothetical protein